MFRPNKLLAALKHCNTTGSSKFLSVLDQPTEKIIPSVYSKTHKKFAKPKKIIIILCVTVEQTVKIIIFLSIIVVPIEKF